MLDLLSLCANLFRTGESGVLGGLKIKEQGSKKDYFIDALDALTSSVSSSRAEREKCKARRTKNLSLGWPKAKEKQRESKKMKVEFRARYGEKKFCRPSKISLPQKEV